MKVCSTFTNELVDLVRRMCYHPDDLKASDIREGTALDIHLKPHRNDRGILIGANERILNAIRQVAILGGRKFGVVAYVHLDGEQGPSFNRVFEHNPAIGEGPFMDVVGRWLAMMFGRAVEVRADWDREKLTLRARLNGGDDGEEITAHTALNALADLVYAIGQREGVIVKLKPLKERVVT